MSTYDLIAGLPFTVERYELEGRERSFREFTRRTTTVHLHGGGHVGMGEDVTYDADAHVAAQGAGPVLPLAGDWTIDSFSSHLASLDLFAGYELGSEVFRAYRTWGYESAALDLALRQAGRPLHEVLAREPRPLQFVVSLRLGNPPSFDPIARRIEAYPGIRFKLDATPDWDDAFVARLAATGAVDQIDFKGAYKGTPVDVDTDPALYRRVAEALPNAWLEDPDLEPPDARAALAPFMDRVTWDAPIHSVADVDALEHPPRGLNVKPSRFGSLRALLDAYDAIAERGMSAYGGGQSELGVGRGQIQLLAALFHPDAPNDVAPSGFDWDDFPSGLTPSPLDPAPDATGFRRRA